MQRDTEKCREMQGNAEKCREMQRNAEKYRGMRRNAERCRERQRDTMLDTYVYGPRRDFIADAAVEPADGNEYVLRKTDADMESVRVEVLRC